MNSLLKLPTAGMNRSVHKHNCRVDYLADWAEANSLLSAIEVDRSDVTDMLTEELYDDQGFAQQRVEQLWSELQQRVQMQGSGTPFILTHDRFARKPRTSWRSHPGHAYCLMLSMCRLYPKEWVGPFGKSVVHQGDLFERLAEASLIAQGWKVHRTGWASGIQNASFANVVQRVAAECRGRENADNIRKLSHYNECGLDLVCQRLFYKDNRPSRPVLLAQCASGITDLSVKELTPSVDQWKYFVTFHTHPLQAFITPLAYDHDEFEEATFRVQGVIIDRYRLLSAGAMAGRWLPAALKQDIVKAIEPKIADLSSLRS